MAKRTKTAKPVVELASVLSIEEIKRLGTKFDMKTLYLDPELHTTWIGWHMDRIAKEMKKLLPLLGGKPQQVVEFFAGRGPMLRAAQARYKSKATYTAVDLYTDSLKLEELAQPVNLVQGFIGTPELSAKLPEQIDLAYTSTCSIAYLNPKQLVQHLTSVRDRLSPDGVYIVAPGIFGMLCSDLDRELAWYRPEGSRLWSSNDVLMEESAHDGRRLLFGAVADPDFTNLRYMEQAFYTFVPEHWPYMVPGIELTYYSTNPAGKIVAGRQPLDRYDPTFLLGIRRTK